MINAGRVLIIPKGQWTNLESYEMLDLVTRGDIAYIARQASVGVDPATDTQLTYWQPFGTAAKIATTTTPGLVMPDGTTVTIDATGLISANIGISDINNVTISSISNGQILQYNSSTQQWENKSLGTAASRNATSAITSGSTDLIESGAVSSLKQTLENEIDTVSAQVSDNDDAYSPSKPYKVGEVCIHDNKLYKCITACSAAAWSVNSGCFSVDTLASVVNDLNTSLNDIITVKLDSVSFTNGIATVSNANAKTTSRFLVTRNHTRDGSVIFGAYCTTNGTLSLTAYNTGDNTGLGGPVTNLVVLIDNR